jgi:hypothetical protein
MAMLSFKKVWIEPIMSGEKTDTIRKATALVRGDIIEAKCEWVKPPFAYLEVTAVEPVAQRDLEPEQRERLAKLYGQGKTLVRIRFRRINAPAGTRTSS